MMMMMMISIPSSVSRLHPAIESRVYGKRQTANVNLYQKTKFSLYASFTVHYSFSKMSSFTPVLSLKTVLDSFYLLIFYLEKFSTWKWRLPFAVDVTLNFSNITIAWGTSPRACH